VRLQLDVSAVPARPVGAGVYTVALAAGLGGRPEVDLHLLARHGDTARWEARAPEATVHPEVPAARPARLAWEQARAARLAHRLGIDVWHGPHYTSPLRLPVPAVVTIHDLTFFDHPEWHQWAKVRFFRRMIAAATRRAAAIVAVSRHTRRRLEAVLRPSAPVTVAVHGVDHDRFRPAPAGRPEDLARLAALGIRRPYLAFAATLEPRKDVPALVAAFGTIAAEHEDLRLVLAGRDGWGADAVRDAAAASGVTTRILRPGWLPGDALAPFFRQAEVVVYPSLEEGFGLPALEALACGAPLVTTSGSAMEEVVGEAALLTPPGDPSALAGALRRLLTDDAARARLREAGPRRAAPYTWAASVDRHLSAYRSAGAVAA
jgi:glycosyltransferase involved in cell wall biosynthesis